MYRRQTKGENAEMNKGRKMQQVSVQYCTDLKKQVLLFWGTVINLNVRKDAYFLSHF